MPTETGGWQVVANSLPALTKEQQSELVARTNAGTLDERSFTDGYGYCGEVKLSGDAWVVFTHLYKSERPVYTGQHFVQRDICLAPLREFLELGCDAQPFLDVLPSAETFARVDSTLAPWRAEPAAADATARLDRLSIFPDEFLREVLLSLLQPHATTIVWQNADASLLTAIFLLFPRVVRRRLTFCTRVGDLAAAQVQVKCVPAFKPDPASAIVDFDRKLFRQPLTTLESALPAQLMTAWRRGKLGDLHRYLDDVVSDASDQTALVRSLDDGLIQWLSKNELIAEIDGKRRWDVARKHIRVVDDAPPAIRMADRLFIAEHLVRHFDPSSEGDRLASFVRELAPDMMETKRLEEAAGARIASSAGDAMRGAAAALVGALPGENVRANLACETFQRLPADRRRLEQLADLEALFFRKGTSLPPPLIEETLRGWTFEKIPKPAEIRSIIKRITSRDRLALLEANARLAASLASVPYGQIALELLRVQFGSGNERALLELAERHPDEAADAVTTQPIDASELAIQLIARIASKARDRKHATAHNELLKELFVTHFERSENEQLLRDERVKLAMQWAGHTEGYKRRIEVVRTRLEGFAAEEPMRELLLAPARAWMNGQAGAARQLLAVISGAPRWAWYVASELHADAEFRLAAFCEALRGAGRESVPFLRMIAALVMHSIDRPRADAVDVLSCCVEAIAGETPADPELRRRIASEWTPSGHKEYSRLLALLTAHTTRPDHEAQRRQGLALMPLEDQLNAIASRLEAFSVSIRDVAHWPELERLDVLGDEQEAIDFSRVENALQRLLESLDESSLERVLKEHAARLRRRKKDGGWFPRPK
jgi:hypothetical protein